MWFYQCSHHIFIPAVSEDNVASPLSQIRHYGTLKQSVAESLYDINVILEPRHLVQKYDILFPENGHASTQLSEKLLNF